MYPLILLLLISVLSNMSAYGQGKRYLDLSHHYRFAKPNSIRHIQVVDARKDTTKLGRIQTGVFNNKANLHTHEATSIALTNYLQHTLNPLPDANDTLLIAMYDCKIYEQTNMTSEYGYLDFYGAAYLKRGLHYYAICKIDTTIITSSLDVTQDLLKRIPVLLCFFVNRAANTLPAHSAEAVEYAQLTTNPIYINAAPILKAAQPKDGVYVSFEEFRDNKPKITNFTITGNPQKIFYRDAEDRFQGQLKEYWGYCENGKPYIRVTQHTSTPLHERNGRFEFDIPKNRIGVMLAAAVTFGAVGATLMLAGTSSKPQHSFYIDMTTGNVIPR